MKTVFHILSDNAKEVQRSLGEIVIEAAKPLEAEMVDMNSEQHDDGLLNTGAKIKPDYSPAYGKAKGRKTPNLIREGDFRSGMYVDFKKDMMLFDSKDDKTNHLETKYSSDIFGLTDKNWKEISDDLLIDNMNEIIINKLLKNT